ncbi:zinc finger TRAF-type-containing protein 1-B-like [Clytia hemisphaerica]|uniref:RING-type domain-containing protein n=1 Tax=Clytia hemisphaerica TaxID=252671 RepID=A0A7M5WUN2_9CNID
MTEVASLLRESIGSVCKDEIDLTPPAKRVKMESEAEKVDEKRERLESRLISVLSCVICFDLPSGSIYQCLHGHLMCIGCFNHLLADARLKNEQAQCPSCRADISSKNSSRNLAVEKAVSELPTYCRYCEDEFPRNQIPFHEKSKCDQRPACCEYKGLGCTWVGVHHQVESHVKDCLFPQKCGADLLENVNIIAAESNEELRRYQDLFQMLSYEKITNCDIQLCPSRSDDYIPKLYYETNKFTAFDQLWTIKAKVVGNEKIAARSLSYQLILKGKGNHEIKYFLTKGPFGDAKISPETQRFEFRDDNKESDYHHIALTEETDCNRLLAARTINFRIMMFLVKK